MDREIATINMLIHWLMGLTIEEAIAHIVKAEEMSDDELDRNIQKAIKDGNSGIRTILIFEKTKRGARP